MDETDLVAIEAITVAGETYLLAASAAAELPKSEAKATRTTEAHLLTVLIPVCSAPIFSPVSTLFTAFSLALLWFVTVITSSLHQRHMAGPVGDPLTPGAVFGADLKRCPLALLARLGGEVEGD